MKKDVRVKRGLAYLLDMFLITLIVMVLSNIDFLNPTIDSYNTATSNYQELYEKYQNKEIDDDTYKESFYQYNYDMSKYGMCYTIFNMVVIVGYFGLFQWLNHGQTLGKKILNIRVSGYKKKELHFTNYLIRLLILNGVLLNLVSLIAINLTNPHNYYYLSYICYEINYVIEVVIIFMIFTDKESRGLHDKLAGTIVIDLNKKEIPDAIYKEVVKEKEDKKEDKKVIIEEQEKLRKKMK